MLYAIPTKCLSYLLVNFSERFYLDALIVVVQRKEVAASINPMSRP